MIKGHFLRMKGAWNGYRVFVKLLYDPVLSLYKYLFSAES